MDLRCRFASLQTPYCADVRDRGLESPRLFMFTSSRRPSFGCPKCHPAPFKSSWPYLNTKNKRCSRWANANNLFDSVLSVHGSISHPDHTSFKIIKDVFDERKRITCFRICPRRRVNQSSRWDAETSSAWRSEKSAWRRGKNAWHRVKAAWHKEHGAHQSFIQVPIIRIIYLSNQKKFLLLHHSRSKSDFYRCISWLFRTWLERRRKSVLE